MTCLPSKTGRRQREPAQRLEVGGQASWAVVEFAGQAAEDGAGFAEIAGQHVLASAAGQARIGQLSIRAVSADVASSAAVSCRGALTPVMAASSPPDSWTIPIGV